MRRPGSGLARRPMLAGEAENVARNNGIATMLKAGASWTKI